MNQRNIHILSLPVQGGRLGAAGLSRREVERRGTGSARRLEPEPGIRRPRVEVGVGGRQV